MKMTPALTELEERLAGPDGEAVRMTSIAAIAALQARCRAEPGDTRLDPIELSRIRILRTACEAAFRTLKAQPR
jgi:hypothetical protein